MAFNWGILTDIVGALGGAYFANEASKAQLSRNDIMDIFREQNPDLYNPYGSQVWDWDAGTRTSEFSPAVQGLFDGLLAQIAEGPSYYQRSPGLDGIHNSQIGYQRSRWGLPSDGDFLSEGPQPQPPGIFEPGDNDDPPYDPNQTGPNPGPIPSVTPPPGNWTGPPGLGGLPGDTDDPRYPDIPRPGNIGGGLGSGNAGRPVGDPGSIGGIFGGQTPLPGLGSNRPAPNRPGSPNWDGRWNSVPEDLSGWMQDNPDLWRLLSAGGSLAGIPGLGFLDDVGRWLYPDQRPDFVGPPGHLGDHRGPLTQQPVIGPEVPGGQAGQDRIDAILGEQGMLDTGFNTSRRPPGGSSGSRPPRPGLGGGGIGQGKGYGWQTVWQRSR